MALVGAKLLLAIVLAVCLTDSITAKIYNNCELAEALLDQGIPKEDVPMWVCIATHESNLNSNAINKGNGDGSWDHGLWQISDKYWVGRNGPGGDCGYAAEEVRGENLENAVKCVHHIWEEHQRLQGDGWLAWAVYSVQGHCRRNDLSSYIAGCF